MANQNSLSKIDILSINIFNFLLRKANITTGYNYFCNKEGTVLIYFPKSDLITPVKEFEIKSLTNSHEYRVISNPQTTYLIITTNESSDILDELSSLLDDFEKLWTIISGNQKDTEYLLECLNWIKPSISIYDKHANLLFANQSFCNDLYIDNLNTYIGDNIEDVLKKEGINVHSMEDNSNQLKMMEVLKTGKEAIDWEVRIESTEHPNQYKLLSNDMYPVLNESGEVQGMVELTHTRQQDIKRTRKIMGLTAEYTFDDIIGSSKILKERIRMAKEYSSSALPFLITGESGVGKELFAQSIHNYGPRHRGPFVALNCANFSDGLIESELFGYVGGAFTGASKNGQIGKFELADGGTLFLDEIGEMPLHFQSKLLRVLETWVITRIGSSKPIPVNVHLIAATNRDLAEMVEEGLFRRDLYYRLQVLTVDVPPLRERKEDILQLAAYFLNQAAEPYFDGSKVLDDYAKELISTYNWPGNVRELRNIINRAAILSKSRIISGKILEDALNISSPTPKKGSTIEDRLSNCHDQIKTSYQNLIKEALDISGGNKKLAAELIGVSRKTFYRMLEKYYV